MKIKFKWGDPMFPESQKIAEVDTEKPLEEAQGHGYILNKMKFHPHDVFPGAVFLDGLNIYRVLEVSGPKLSVGDIYTSRNRALCKPVKILGMRKIGNIQLYRCEIGYRGKTRKYWKTEWALLNHLRSHWWLSWLF